MSRMLPAVAFCLLMSSALGAQAHDLFATIAPASAEPERVAVVNNGTFHESAGAFPRARLRDVSLVAAGQRSRPDLSSWKEVGRHSELRFTPPGEGTYLLGVSTQVSRSTRTAAEFAEYLAIEDLPDTLATYDASRFPDGVTYGYSKHARAIGQAGERLTDDYAASLDYPLEIRLSRNPGRLAVGERVAFEVLHRGVPVPGLRVYAGTGAVRPPTGSHDPGTLLRTDASGKANFEVTHAGTWFIHANRMVPSNETGLDFVSDRASLTFEVRPACTPKR